MGQVARICAAEDLFHLVNNAYGVQVSPIFGLKRTIRLVHGG